MSPRPVLNPPNPFARYSIEWLDIPPDAKLQVFEEEAKSIVASNDSPDVGFRYSVNPYRGCFHGCAYCYARRTHEYLDFGAGSDFERKIVAKVNAPELLRQAFLKKSWRRECLAFSGVTDCYQPLEACYELTRQCLKLCVEFENPVVIITKGALIRRDIDVLQQLVRDAGVRVFISIAFADDQISKQIEPFAPRPSVRFRAMQELAEAGIPVGVGVAPIIPGLNDTDIKEILERAVEAGARSAFMTLLRLPGSVKDVFVERLEQAFPSRAPRVLNNLKEMRSGVFNNPEFRDRMVGEGPRWKALEWVFKSSCEKLGLNARADEEEIVSSNKRQLELF